MAKKASQDSSEHKMRCGEDISQKFGHAHRLLYALERELSRLVGEIEHEAAKKGCICTNAMRKREAERRELDKSDVVRMTLEALRRGTGAFVPLDESLGDIAAKGGFVCKRRDKVIWYVFPEYFRQIICREHDYRHVFGELFRTGHILKRDSDHFTMRKEIPGYGSKRYIAIYERVGR